MYKMDLPLSNSYTSHIMDLPSSINTRQRECWMEFTDQRETIMCDTTCIVDG